MFLIDEEKIIHCTRGDAAVFSVGALLDGAAYTFNVGDVIRFNVMKRKECASVVLSKDFAVAEPTEAVEISLAGDETKIGDVISKPLDYWYEVELNPDTNPQTIIGYDTDGAKIFRLYPEGMEV